MLSESQIESLSFLNDMKKKTVQLKHHIDQIQQLSEFPLFESRVLKLILKLCRERVRKRGKFTPGLSEREGKSSFRKRCLFELFENGSGGYYHPR